MPLYKITEKATNKKHLVDATSSSSALRHVASGMFSIETMTNPTEVADLMDQGVPLERAGKDAEPAETEKPTEPEKTSDRSSEAGDQERAPKP